jgi:hypothetical protein
MIPGLLAMLALAACSSDEGADPGTGLPGGGGSGSAGTGGGGNNNQPLDIPCEEPDSLSVQGLFGAVLNLVVKIDSAGTMITICPEEQLAEVQMYVLIKLDQDESDPTKITNAELRVCDLVMPEVTGKVGICNAGETNLVKTVLTVPDALQAHLRNLPPEAVKATLSNLSPGAALEIERFDFVAGTTGDKLPAWDSSVTGCGMLDTDVGRGRICSEQCVEGCDLLTDDDSDSFPGVTLSICGRTTEEIEGGVQCDPEQPALSGAALDGKAWVALNIDPEMKGTVTNSCQFNGNVASGVVYTLVGGDVFLEGAPLAVAAAIDNLPSFIVKSAESPFQAVRVDGQHGGPNLNVTWGDADGSCATLLNKRHELFE